MISLEFASKTVQKHLCTYSWVENSMVNHFSDNLAILVGNHRASQAKSCATSHTIIFFKAIVVPNISVNIGVFYVT